MNIDFLLTLALTMAAIGAQTWAASKASRDDRPFGTNGTACASQTAMSIRTSPQRSITRSWS
jgi:hypothetical protein